MCKILIFFLILFSSLNVKAAEFKEVYRHQLPELISDLNYHTTRIKALLFSQDTRFIIISYQHLISVENRTETWKERTEIVSAQSGNLLFSVAGDYHDHFVDKNELHVINRDSEIDKNVRVYQLNSGQFINSYIPKPEPRKTPDNHILPPGDGGNAFVEYVDEEIMVGFYWGYSNPRQISPGQFRYLRSNGSFRLFSFNYVQPPYSPQFFSRYRKILYSFGSSGDGLSVGGVFDVISLDLLLEFKVSTEGGSQGEFMVDPSGKYLLFVNSKKISILDKKTGGIIQELKIAHTSNTSIASSGLLLFKKGNAIHVWKER